VFTTVESISIIKLTLHDASLNRKRH